MSADYCRYVRNQIDRMLQSGESLRGYELVAA